MVRFLAVFRFRFRRRFGSSFGLVFSPERRRRVKNEALGLFVAEEGLGVLFQKMAGLRVLTKMFL